MSARADVHRWPAAPRRAYRPAGPNRHGGRSRSAAGVTDRCGHPWLPDRAASRHRLGLLRQLRGLLTDAVGDEELIATGVAQRVEEAPAAMRVAPALGVYAAGVVARIEKIPPRLRVGRRRIWRAHQMRLAAVHELELRTRSTVGACNQQHRRRRQCATAAAAA